MVELTDVLTRLSLAVVNLGKCPLAAKSSQVIESVSVRKLSEQKVGLEIMQVAVEKYIQSNEENGTSAALLTLTDMVNDAYKQIKIVHTVLTVEHHGFYMSEL